jgi:hypothetical protein
MRISWKVNLFLIVTVRNSSEIPRQSSMPTSDTGSVDATHAAIQAKKNSDYVELVRLSAGVVKAVISYFMDDKNGNRSRVGMAPSLQTPEVVDLKGNSLQNGNANIARVQALIDGGKLQRARHVKLLPLALGCLLGCEIGGMEEGAVGRVSEEEWYTNGTYYVGRSCGESSEWVRRNQDVVRKKK